MVQQKLQSVATCNIPNVLTNDLDFQLGNKDGSVGLPVPEQISLLLILS